MLATHDLNARGARARTAGALRRPAGATRHEVRRSDGVREMRASWRRLHAVLRLHRRRRRRHRPPAVGRAGRAARSLRRRAQPDGGGHHAVHQPAVGREGARDDRAATLGVAVAGRTEGVETSTMVRPADRPPGGEDGGSAGRAARLPALRRRGTAGRPAVLARAAGETRRSGAARNCWSQLECEVGDDILIGTAASRFAASASWSRGRAWGRLQLRSRVLVDAADLEGAGLLGLRQPRRPRHPADGARAASNRSSTTAARGAARAVRERPLVPRHRGAGGRGPVAGGELLEPRRARHRDPRGDRRVERDEGVRPAEGPEHRDPQVPRGDEPPGVRGVYRAGVAAGAGRVRAGSGPRARPAWRRVPCSWPGSPVCRPFRTR